MTVAPPTWGFVEIVRGVETPVSLKLGFDVTGMALAFTVRDEGGAVLLSKTTAAGITIVNAAAGDCQLVVTEAESLAIPAGQHAFDVRRTDAGMKEVLVRDGVLFSRTRPGSAS
jgi:hypothetical protein